MPLPRVAVAVSPARELELRPALFGALSKAFDVDFIDTLNHPAQAAIIFADTLTPVSIPTVPTLEILPPMQFRDSTSFAVSFDQTMSELRPLWHSPLNESRRWSPRPIEPNVGEEIIAQVNGRAIWVRSKNGVTHHRASLQLEELGANETLSDHFCDERAWALLPVVIFLRNIAGKIVLPPIRASFIIDDPNIRFRSYGYINFERLITRAKRDHFHISIATILLDMWWSSRVMSAFANRNTEYLSFLFHGNNHTKTELAIDQSPDKELAIVHQAMHRAEGFKNRYGIDLSRVMAPPHGMCSRTMLAAIRAAGFDALVVSRPTPWLPHSHLREILNGNLLQGWFPADYVEGLPVLHRQKNLRNIRFKALLGQPIILYFHHTDFVSGEDAICELAASINSLGDVQWTSLGDIAASNFITSHTGSALSVLPFSRHISLRIEENIDTLTIRLPLSDSTNGNPVARIGTRRYPFFQDNQELSTEPIPLTGENHSEITLEDSIPVLMESAHRFTPLHAIARRFLTEARDRLMPLVKPGRY
jgi:hypothetical protein